MKSNPSISIQQITDKIINFKHDIGEMLESGLERPADSWKEDRDALNGLVITAKSVAARSINGAMKMTLMILIENSLDTINEIDEKIKDLPGSDKQEKEEGIKESVAVVASDEESARNESVIHKMNMMVPSTQPVPEVKNDSTSLIRVQRIFKRSKNGHSYKTFLYLEENEEMHQLTNNELKRKNYRGDINGFQKFLTDKGYNIAVVSIVDMPDMVKRY